MNRAETIAFIKDANRRTRALFELGEKYPKELGSLLENHQPLYSHEPPKRFERYTGFTGISGHYKFLEQEGLSRDHFEILGVRLDKTNYADTPKGHQKLLDVVDLLRAENPSLGAIQFDRKNPLQALDLLMGAACGFNVDDIDFYLNRRDELRSVDYRKVGEKIRAQLLDRFGERGAIEWNPSLNTLQKIEEQIPRLLRKLPSSRVVNAEIEQVLPHLHI